LAHPSISAEQQQLHANNNNITSISIQSIQQQQRRQWWMLDDAKSIDAIRGSVYSDGICIRHTYIQKYIQSDMHI